MTKVGLVYDPVYLKHDTGAHVENASRLTGIASLLESSGLKARLLDIPPRPATLEELALVHPRSHVEQIRQAAESGGGWLDADTVVSPGSYQAAIYAAGGVLEAVDAVLAKKADSAFALVRPPGHHATPDRAMGFCLFNNVAIAARYALTRHGLKRVMIVDWDVHHGNGTQEVFYSEPRVLYFSTHEYPFYPGSGAVEELGTGPGEGNMVNVPLPAGCGDPEYIRVFEEVVTPVADRFKPQLILVSAGYDAHWADPLASMEVTVAGYARMTGIIKRLAEAHCAGRMVFALEGGYNVEALAHSVRATLETLLGISLSPDPLGEPARSSPRPNIDALLTLVKRAHGLG
ncbi:MAG: histone deacetylase [Dehalococcoidia bacterium]|nr:histone deacetylase [Dehalococcoidia bacterium]